MFESLTDSAEHNAGIELQRFRSRFTTLLRYDGLIERTEEAVHRSASAHAGKTDRVDGVPTLMEIRWTLLHLSQTFTISHPSFCSSSNTVIQQAM